MRRIGRLLPTAFPNRIHTNNATTIAYTAAGGRFKSTATTNTTMPPKKKQSSSDGVAASHSISAQVPLHAPPANWRALFDGIAAARATIDAPVDTIGCHMLKDRTAPREVQRYQTLLSLLLSAQTRDQCTAQAMQQLIAYNKCTPEAINETSEDKVRELISCVCFYNNKARYVKAVTSRIMAAPYNGVVPSDYDALVAMPGLGPKMVHIFMQAADGVVTGIGVDVHVHRLAQRFKWVPSTLSFPTHTNKDDETAADSSSRPSSGKAGAEGNKKVLTPSSSSSSSSSSLSCKPVKTPEDTRACLESWMPRELWAGVNVMLVGYGQTVCPAVAPRCGQCAVRDLCPSAFAKGKGGDVADGGVVTKKAKQEKKGDESDGEEADAAPTVTAKRSTVLGRKRSSSAVSSSPPPPPLTATTSVKKEPMEDEEMDQPPLHQKKRAQRGGSSEGAKENSSSAASPLLDMEELCRGLSSTARRGRGGSGRGRGAGQ